MKIKHGFVANSSSSSSYYLFEITKEVFEKYSSTVERDWGKLGAIQFHKSISSGLAIIDETGNGMIIDTFDKEVEDGSIRPEMYYFMSEYTAGDYPGDSFIDNFVENYLKSEAKQISSREPY